MILVLWLTSLLNLIPEIEQDQIKFLNSIF